MPKDLKTTALNLLGKHGANVAKAETALDLVLRKNRGMRRELQTEYLDRLVAARAGGGQLPVDTHDGSAAPSTDDGQSEDGTHMLRAVVDSEAGQRSVDTQVRGAGLAPSTDKPVHVRPSKKFAKRGFWRAHQMTQDEKDAAERAKLVGLGVFKRRRIDRVRWRECDAVIGEKLGNGVEMLDMGRDQIITAAVIYQAKQYAQPADDGIFLADLVPEEKQIEFELAALKRTPELLRAVQEIARAELLKRLPPAAE